MCEMKLQASGARPAYQAYDVSNFRTIPQITALTAEQCLAIEVVAKVFPFRTNSYVVDRLIDWDKAPDDPCFRINFPQADMLKPAHFARLADLMRCEATPAELGRAAAAIRQELNPHPAGQMDCNLPTLDGQTLPGLQHKYNETVLFFPSHGQTCHAYCTFCFRWPQFIADNGMRIEAREVDPLIRYLAAHPTVSEVLITGGDPLVMKAAVLERYLQPLLASTGNGLRTIRIGTKALASWPQRFLSDPDADQVLALFEKVVRSGKRLAIMAHFNHPREFSSDPVRAAIARIIASGAQIFTQSPLLSHINDDPLWAAMWRDQASLGCVPYYMFIVRDTGAQHYFGVPLVRAWHIFREAYQSVSGLARTVRGPVMSAHCGKVQVLGVCQVNGRPYLNLQLVQGRQADWVLKPFLAEYDSQAIWVDQLRPAFGEAKFPFQ